MNRQNSSNNNKDANVFVSENIKNFNCGDGWSDLIKLFFIEILNAGWSKDKTIFGKEKFGSLRISLSIDNPDPVLLSICHKYETISETTCESCGSPGKHRVINGWEHTLCFDHYLENYPVVRVERLNFNKIFRTEFEWNYERVLFYTRGFLGHGHESFYASSNFMEINYYALLKAIPKAKLDHNDYLHIDHFFSKLLNCKICGYKAVFNEKCHYCMTEQWNGLTSTRPHQPHHSTELQYIKEMQMDWELDNDDFRKIKASNEIAFEQVIGHQILFTPEELIRYVENQSKEDQTLQ